MGSPRVNTKPTERGPVPSAAMASSRMSSVEKAVIRETMGREDRYGDEAGVIGAFEKAGGYSALLADPKRTRDLEDMLEPLVVSRAVDVRNALRDLGWVTLSGTPDHSALHKDGYVFEARFDKGPSGHNVVSYTAFILEEESGAAYTRIPDRLQVGSKVFAEKVDADLGISRVEPWTNGNCLAGLSCPMCGEKETLLITVEGVLDGDAKNELTVVAVRMADDGFSEPLFHGDTEWMGPCECPTCHFAGDVSDFQEQKEDAAPTGASSPKSALSALASLGVPSAAPSSDDRLKNALGNVRSEFVGGRTTAAWMLADYPDERALEGLAILTKDADWRVRRRAAHSLGVCLEVSKDSLGSTLEFQAGVIDLAGLLSDPDDLVRREAAYAVLKGEDTEAQAKVWTVLQGVQGYPFAIDRNGYDSWEAIKNQKAKPNAEQAVLMKVAEQLLDEGVFYQEEFYQKALTRLPKGFFSATDLQRQPADHAVERGMAGYEIYLARRAVEARRSLATDREEMKKLEVGQVLRDIRVGTQKFATATVKELDVETGKVTVVGTKRGTRDTWRVMVEAKALTHEMAIKEQFSQRNVGGKV